MSTFVVVAGGPSLTLNQVRAVGIARARRNDITVIAVNDAVYPCWFADYAYACDGQWWDWHRGLPNFRGGKIKLLVRDGNGIEINATQIDGLETFEASGAEGLDLRPTHITTGKNGGAQAVHVAYHLGAKRIVLVAFDFREVTKHWFGKHPKAISRVAKGVEWVKLIERLGADLKKQGVDIVNATPGSEIKAFPFVDLEQELGVAA